MYFDILNHCYNNEYVPENKAIEYLFEMRNHTDISKWSVLLLWLALIFLWCSTPWANVL